MLHNYIKMAWRNVACHKNANSKPGKKPADGIKFIRLNP
jgi:hypothetical protein